MYDRTAYPLKDGQFRIWGETYHFRDAIRAAGGRWDGHAWIGPREAAFAAKADIMVHVRVAAHCHEEERDIWAPETDVARGFIRMGCGMCDTSYRCGRDVPILGPAANDSQEPPLQSESAKAE